MEHYLYAVWLRNLDAAEDDEDREWMACMFVTAESAAEAQVWGDHLALAYVERRPEQQFLGSSLESETGGEAPPEHLASVPVIAAGHEASDEEIGW